MTAVPRFYKNHIAEGKGILIFSIVLALLMRIIFAITSDTSFVDTEGGYLWQLLSEFSSNLLYSFIGSSVIVGAMALSVAHINTDFVLIRRRTLLPPALIILLFSCHPSFLWISPAYMGVLFILLIISVLFSAYNDSVKAVSSFKISFILSLGSLFAPLLVFFIPLSWLALIIMRCFNFKSLLASLFGAFVIYFPVFSFYLFTDNLDEFFAPFIIGINIENLILFPFLDLNTISFIFIAFTFFLLSIIITDNYINRHKDKIRIRAYLSLLTFLILLSLSFFLFLNIMPKVSLYISIGIGSLLVSHFFALIETKGSMVLFYVCFLFYILFSIFSFLTIV